MKEARPLKDWQNWRRADANDGSPMTTAYEFALVSKVARPQAMTRVHARNPPNAAFPFSRSANFAVGQNLMQSG